MILQYFFKKENKDKKIANLIYNDLLKASNTFLMKNEFFINKNYNTSFELVSIFLIFYINKNIFNKIKNYQRINDNLISIFISDLDESLRSKGIGDMSIGKYVKSYVKKFYFRLKKFPKKNQLDSNDILNYLQNFYFIHRNDQKNASLLILDFFKKIEIRDM